jgi:hypothetical protein
VGAEAGAGAGAGAGWDFFVFFFFGGGDSTDASTRPVETGFASSGVVGVAGFGVAGGSGGVGGLGEWGFVGAGSGLGAGCGFGWAAGCGRGAASGADGWGCLIFTGRETKLAAPDFAREGWWAVLAGCALAAWTVWTCRAGRVLTCDDRAGFLAGRSTVLAPVDWPLEDPVGGAAGGGAVDPELVAFGCGAGAAPVATEAGCEGCSIGLAAR